jgi:hypothetical protein
MRGYNNSLAAAALLLGMKPEDLMLCLQSTNTIAELQATIENNQRIIERLNKDNDALVGMISKRVATNDN